MAFVGLDPIKMRDLASRSDSVSSDVARLAERAATIISVHQLDDVVGDLGSLLDETQIQMRDLASLATTKAADMERAAQGGLAPPTSTGDPNEPPRRKSPRFEELSELRDLLEELRGYLNDGGAPWMTVLKLNSLLIRLTEMTSSERAWVLSRLTDEELDWLFDNMYNDGGFLTWSWGDAERFEFFRLVEKFPAAARVRFAAADARHAVEGDPKAQAALESLQNSEGYKLASDPQKAAMLHQAKNYPNEDSIYNLERLASKEWARDFNINDFEQSAKMIADLSQGGGDRKILDNTLDAFLADDAVYRFDWAIDPTLENHAWAVDNVVSFNPRYLWPGSGDVASSVPPGEDELDTWWMIRAGAPHEVNHLRNGDEVSESFDYFMGEYRADYVGKLAQNGKAPSRYSMAFLFTQLLDPANANDPDSGYGDLVRALDDPVEGPRIAAWAEKVLGRKVKPDEIFAVAQEIVTKGAGTNDPVPVPVPVDGGSNNLDNGP